MSSDISFGSTFGPEFATDIVPYGGGTEQRLNLWPQGRMRGDVRHGVKTVAQLQNLLTFFYVRRGKAQGFRFKWHLDYQATRAVFGIGDGVTTIHQLSKPYVSGGETYVRPIRKPVGVGYPLGNDYDSVNLYVDAGVIASGYEIDYTTGTVTFGAPFPLGVELSWSGEFDVPMRFDTDKLAESMTAIWTLDGVFDGVGLAEPIPIIELLAA